MRIAMVANAISRKGAGIANAVEGLSASLLARGHEVRVFAINDDAWCDDAASWQGAPVSTFNTIGPAAIGYAPEMLGAILTFAPEITHLHGLWMHSARSVAQWSRHSGRPFVISPHGMLASAALGYSPAKKRLARWLYHDRSFREAAGFHASSAREVQEIQSFGIKQPIDLVPHGIELRARPERATPGRTILSLGRLHPVKGLDVLVDAWARIESRFPGWDLRIVGPDNHGYAAELRIRAKVQGLERLTIEGPVYGDEKFERLAAAGLFVLPSRSENFALTVVESLMMGTPVVASQGTPWSNLVGRGCGAWVPAEPIAFAEAIATLLQCCDSDRNAMGEAGREWVRETFSWAAVAQLAEAAYERRMA